jgi:uncharacterized membrane protein
MVVLAIAKTYFILGLVYVGLGLPLFFERIKPNRWYGFRTSKTLSDPGIWYPANRIAGFDLVLAGVLIIVSSVLSLILYQFFPALPFDIINLIVLITSTLAVTIHCLWYLRRL